MGEGTYEWEDGSGMCEGTYGSTAEQTNRETGYAADMSYAHNFGAGFPIDFDDTLISSLVSPPMNWPLWPHLDLASPCQAMDMQQPPDSMFVDQDSLESTGFMSPDSQANLDMILGHQFANKILDAGYHTTIPDNLSPNLLSEAYSPSWHGLSQTTSTPLSSADSNIILHNMDPTHDDSLIQGNAATGASPRVWKCPGCSKKTKAARDMDRHIDRKHKPLAKQLGIKSEDVKCPYSGCRRIGRRDNIKRHFDNLHRGTLNWKNGKAVITWDDDDDDDDDF